MTSKQPNSEPKGPPVKLQHLKFSPEEVDDNKAVYKASIQKPDARFTLTVTVAAKLYETEVLKGFLSEIEA